MHLSLPHALKAGLCLALLVMAQARAADPHDQSGVPLEQRGTAGHPTVILLAGSPSSKPLGHEYFAGCALFADWLRLHQVHPIMVRDGWPRNEALLDQADAIVFYMDGGEKMSFLEDSRWARIRRLEARGVGMVFLHQMVEFPPARTEEALGWVGALFAKDAGGRGHWESGFESFPEHPVARGLQPFSINDGWLYGYDLAQDAAMRLTPILATRPPDSSRKSEASKKNAGREEMIAWTYERPNGGRSFAFTAADWHPNWEVESVRRLVLNGILWTARQPIPTHGARVPLADGALNRNLDDKRPANPVPGRPGANPAVTYLDPTSLEGVVLDDLQGTMKGNWTGSSSTGPQIVGRSYFHDGGKNKGECSVTFLPRIEATGRYALYLHAPPHGNRSDHVPVHVTQGSRSQTVWINQKDVKAGTRQSLGTWELEAGQPLRVEVSNEGTKGIVVVDALQLIRLK